MATIATITRINPDDVVAMNAKGFFALRPDCVDRTRLDEIAYEESEQWLAEATEAEREADPEGQEAYVGAYESWASSAYDGYTPGVWDGRLHAHIDDLYQVAVEDDRLEDGWGVSTGSGLATASPHYVVEIDGEDVYLAPAVDDYPTPCYA